MAKFRYIFLLLMSATLVAGALSASNASAAPSSTAPSSPQPGVAPGETSPEPDQQESTTGTPPESSPDADKPYSRIVVEPNSPTARDLVEPIYRCSASTRWYACQDDLFVIEQVERGTDNVIGRYFADFSFATRNDVRNTKSTAEFDVSIREVMEGSTDGGFLTLKIIATQYEESTNPQDKVIRTIQLPVNDGAKVEDQQWDEFTKRLMKPDTYTNSTYKIEATYTPPPDHDPLVPTGTKPVNGVEVRCDNAGLLQSGTAGCVNPGYWPTATFYESRTPDIAQNILNGQSTLNGIGTPSGGPVHRVSDTERDANRKIACSDARKAALPAPRPGMERPSCDEYPFASTLEGGANTVIAWVPLSENSSQGATLKNFYNLNRVLYFPLAKDAYYVLVAP